MSRQTGNYPLFSGGQIRSPVSRRALGECNAITCRKIRNSQLTFDSSTGTQTWILGDRKLLQSSGWKQSLTLGDVLDRTRIPVHDHVVWEPVDFRLSIFIDVGITDVHGAHILILN